MSAISKKVFNLFHTNKLVYNTCWEDPECDKMLMDLDEDSKIVMITSAGCNALSYLLDDAQRIDCIDLNYRQNSLLELKKSVFHNNDYALLREMFGTGRLQDASTVYRTKLRERLPDYAQEYWDDKIKYFAGKNMRDSFYFRGTSGMLAYTISKYLRLKKDVGSQVSQIFKSQTLQEQTKYYHNVSKYLWTDVVSWFLNNHVVMSLAGVPKSQQALFMNDYDRGTVGFLEKQFEHVFTQLPARENYFYHVYFEGSYSDICCPEYVREENFETLRSRVDRIHTHTDSISGFLQKNPGEYSHYVLLDHQDWMAANDIPALEEEWDLILKNSRIGTKILLRSAAKEIDFFPEIVQECVRFDPEQAQKSIALDRVGTYTSTYIGKVVNLPR